MSDKKKLTIKSVIDDNDPTVERHFCCFEKAADEYKIIYNQPLYDGKSETVITLSGNTATMTRQTPNKTELSFIVGKNTVGSYFTGLDVTPVNVNATRVSADESKNNIKIRLHYTIDGLSDKPMTVKLCLTVE